VASTIVSRKLGVSAIHTAVEGSPQTTLQSLVADSPSSASSSTTSPIVSPSPASPLLSPSSAEEPPLASHFNRRLSNMADDDAHPDNGSTESHSALEAALSLPLPTRVIVHQQLDAKLKMPSSGEVIMLSPSSDLSEGSSDENKADDEGDAAASSSGTAGKSQHHLLGSMKGRQAHGKPPPLNDKGSADAQQAKLTPRAMFSERQWSTVFTCLLKFKVADSKSLQEVKSNLGPSQHRVVQVRVFSCS